MVRWTRVSSLSSEISPALPRTNPNCRYYASSNFLIYGNVDSLGHFKRYREAIGNGPLYLCSIFSAVDFNRQGIAVSERDSQFAFSSGVTYELSSMSGACSSKISTRESWHTAAILLISAVALLVPQQ